MSFVISRTSLGAGHNLMRPCFDWAGQLLSLHTLTPMNSNCYWIGLASGMISCDERMIWRRKSECWIIVDTSDPVGLLVQSTDVILIDVLSTDYHDRYNNNCVFKGTIISCRTVLVRWPTVCHSQITVFPKDTGVVIIVINTH